MSICNCKTCECMVEGNNLHVRNGVCFNCSVGNHFGKLYDGTFHEIDADTWDGS